MAEKNNDRLLLFNMSRGDEDAFKELYDGHWEYLFRYVAGIVRVQDEAEDILQDVFITLWGMREDLIRVRELRPYLVTMVRHKVVKHALHHKRRHEYLDSLVATMETYEQSPEQSLCAVELSGYVEREIAKLPSKMREVFSLSRQEGLSHKEIAERLSISPHTVKKQINNSIRLIRRRLGHLSLWLAFMALVKLF